MNVKDKVGIIKKNPESWIAAIDDMIKEGVVDQAYKTRMLKFWGLGENENAGKVS